MRSTKTQEGQNRPMELASLEAVWERIRELLEAEKHRISTEIRSYPPPIPACDAQFNYLLEQRSGISQELHRMRKAHEASLSDEYPVQVLHTFIASSRCMSAEARHELLTLLHRDCEETPTCQADPLTPNA